MGNFRLHKIVRTQLLLINFLMRNSSFPEDNLACRGTCTKKVLVQMARVIRRCPHHPGLDEFMKTSKTASTNSATIIGATKKLMLRVCMA